MKKKFLILSLMFALVSGFALDAYAIGCPTKCASAGEDTGYCADSDGSEGGRECVSTGTGAKECTGTVTPLLCDPE